MEEQQPHHHHHQYKQQHSETTAMTTSTDITTTTTTTTEVMEDDVAAAAAVGVTTTDVENGDAAIDGNKKLTTATEAVLEGIVDDDDDEMNQKCCSYFRFQGIQEAQGFAAVTSARGTVVLANIFLSTALIYLASEAAGCLPSNNANDDDDNITTTTTTDIDDDDTITLICTTEKIYGFKPSSLITILAVISGLLSAFIMPIIGAIIDLTPYRRHAGIFFAIILCLIQVIQVGTVSSTWFIMSILQAIAGTIYELLGMISHAYLPELNLLVNNELKMSKLVASFTVVTFSSELAIIIVVVTITFILHFNDVQMAQLSQGINAIYISILFYIGFYKKLPNVAILHKPCTITHNNDNDENNNNNNNTTINKTKILIAGFKQIYYTIKGINTHYKDTLRWFFLAVVFVNAGANALIVISVTYQSDFLQMNGIQIGINLFIVLLTAIPGAIFGTIPTKKFNPNTSWKLSIIFFIIITIVAAYVLDSPKQANKMYIFATLWGLSLGWFYSVMTTFFSMCLPKGQQAELSGFYIYCRLILSWLPPLLFTIMNEAGINMQYGLMSISIWLFIGFICLFFITSWENVTKQTLEQSKNIIL